MGLGVLSSQDYQYEEPGVLVDNLPWQEEIRKRLREEEDRALPLALPAEPTVFEAPSLTVAEAEAAQEVVEEVKPPEPTQEEIMAKAKAEAEETARAIEQAAKKNAFEIVEQARWEGNDLIARAKEEAEKEILQMKETAQEEGRKEGTAQGRQEGLETGRSEGRQEFAGSVAKWNDMLGQLVSERKQLLNDLKPVVVDLTGEALYRCLKDEAQKHRQMVVGFAQEALDKAQDRVHLKLHLNPEDIGEVESQKDRLGLSVGAKGLELVPDARVERGGCRLETEAGSVDVTLPTVVEKVKKTLESDQGWK